jgi:hypothetical protein
MDGRLHRIQRRIPALSVRIEINRGELELTEVLNQRDHERRVRISQEGVHEAAARVCPAANLEDRHGTVVATSALRRARANRSSARRTTQ